MVQPGGAVSSEAMFLIAAFVIGMSIIVMTLAAIVFLHHLWSDRVRRLNRERFEGAATFLAQYLVTIDSNLEGMVDVAVKRFGSRAVSLVLRRARFDLKGPVSYRISTALVEMGAVNELIRETSSRRDWKRVGAARGLGECGGEKARAVLMDLAINDPVGEVRRAAREGLLTEHVPEATRIAVDSFLKDLPRRAGWRRSFYARLAAVAAPDLLHLIRSGQLQPSEEKLALEALGDAGSLDALPLAIGQSRAKQQELRATGIRVVGKLGGEQEMPIVIHALEDEAWFVRAAAARSLEWMLGSRSLHLTDPKLQSESTSLLGRCLGDSSWWVRANAARALGRSGQHGIGVLFAAAEGHDRYARDSALAALAMSNLATDQKLRLRYIIDNLPLLEGHEQKGFTRKSHGEGATN
jgi:HEAT repeat protein